MEVVRSNTYSIPSQPRNLSISSCVADGLSYQTSKAQKLLGVVSTLNIDTPFFYRRGHWSNEESAQSTMVKAIRESETHSACRMDMDSPVLPEFDRARLRLSKPTEFNAYAKDQNTAPVYKATHQAEQALKTSSRPITSVVSQVQNSSWKTRPPSTKRSSFRFSWHYGFMIDTGSSSQANEITKIKPAAVRHNLTRMFSKSRPNAQEGLYNSANPRPQYLYGENKIQTLTPSTVVSTREIVAADLRPESKQNVYSEKRITCCGGVSQHCSQIIDIEHQDAGVNELRSHIQRHNSLRTMDERGDQDLVLRRLYKPDEYLKIMRAVISSPEAWDKQSAVSSRCSDHSVFSEVDLRKNSVMSFSDTEDFEIDTGIDVPAPLRARSTSNASSCPATSSIFGREPRRDASGKYSHRTSPPYLVMPTILDRDDRDWQTHHDYQQAPQMGHFEQSASGLATPAALSTANKHQFAAAFAVDARPMVVSKQEQDLLTALRRKRADMLLDEMPDVSTLLGDDDVTITPGQCKEMELDLSCTSPTDPSMEYGIEIDRRSRGEKYLAPQQGQQSIGVFRNLHMAHHDQPIESSYTSRDSKAVVSFEGAPQITQEHDNQDKDSYQTRIQEHLQATGSADHIHIRHLSGFLDIDDNHEDGIASVLAIVTESHLNEVPVNITSGVGEQEYAGDPLESLGVDDMWPQTPKPDLVLPGPGSMLPIQHMPVSEHEWAAGVLCEGRRPDMMG